MANGGLKGGIYVDMLFFWGWEKLTWPELRLVALLPTSVGNSNSSPGLDYNSRLYDCRRCRSSRYGYSAPRQLLFPPFLLPWSLSLISPPFFIEDITGVIGMINATSANCTSDTDDGSASAMLRDPSPPSSSSTTCSRSRPQLSSISVNCLQTQTTNEPLAFHSTCRLCFPSESMTIPTIIQLYVVFFAFPFAFFSQMGLGRVLWVIGLILEIKSIVAVASEGRHATVLIIDQWSHVLQVLPFCFYTWATCFSPLLFITTLGEAIPGSRWSGERRGLRGIELDFPRVGGATADRDSESDFDFDFDANSRSQSRFRFQFRFWFRWQKKSQASTIKLSISIKRGVRWSDPIMLCCLCLCCFRKVWKPQARCECAIL